MVEKIRLSEESYKQLYEQIIEENEYLKGFIGSSTVSRIAEIEKENEVLRIENASLKGQVSEKDKHIESLRIETDKRIEQEVRIAKREKDNEYAVKLKNKGINERSRLRANEVKPLKQQVEQQEQEIDRLQEMHKETMTKLEQVLNELSTNTEIAKQVLELVKNLVESGEPKNKIVDTINSAIEQVNNKKVNNQSIIEECTLIHNLLEQGKNQKQIATILYPDLARREIKVSDRINSKTYQKLYGTQ